MKKSECYNNIVNVLKEKEVCDFEPTIKVAHGRVKSVFKDNGFYYAKIRKVGHKDKKLNLRLLNREDLVSIEKVLLNK